MDFSVHEMRMLADMFRRMRTGSVVWLPTKAMKVKRKRYQKQFAQSRGKKVRGR